MNLFNTRLNSFAFTSPLRSPCRAAECWGLWVCMLWTSLLPPSLFRSTSCISRTTPGSSVPPRRVAYGDSSQASAYTLPSWPCSSLPKVRRKSLHCPKLFNEQFPFHPRHRKVTHVRAANTLSHLETRHLPPYHKASTAELLVQHMRVFRKDPNWFDWVR